MSGERRILVVGGGFSGTALVIQLIRSSSLPLEIVLVEPREILGRGVAYGTIHEEHLLNVPVGKMSLYPDQPEHFLQWARRVREKSGIESEKEIAPGDFLPRKLFGDYIVEQLSTALADASVEVTLHHERDEAIDLQERPEGGALLLLQSGKVLEARWVVLALGNLPSHYPIAKRLPVYDSLRYVHFPWAGGRLEKISPDDPVLLVGAGLTSVDIALQLHANGHRAPIYALSRRGHRPQNHRATQPWPLFLDRENLPRTLRPLLRKVREEIRLAERRGSGWRAVIDALRPVTQAIWQGFSIEEKKRFLRHLRPYWEVHRHRLAPPVAERIESLENEKKLYRWAGRLVRLVEVDGGVEARIRLLGGSTELDLKVGWVVNCTGPRSDFSKFDHPLLISLLASGLLYHDPLALGFHADAEGALIPFGKKEPADWIFTLGAPLKGVLWETTAVPELRGQAERLAKKLLERIGDTPKK